MNKYQNLQSISDSLSQGKSLRYLSEWSAHREYFNDDCVQDFVTYNNILWGCMKNCKGHRPSEDCIYWSKAVIGPKGDKGKEIVTMYESENSFDDTYSYSTITVVYSDASKDSFIIKNKLSKGDRGDKGDKGDPFKYSDFTDAQLADLKGPAGENGKDGKDGKDGAIGPQGIQGIQGIQGVPGINGKTPQITMEGNKIYSSYLEEGGIPVLIGEIIIPKNELEWQLVD